MFLPYLPNASFHQSKTNRICYLKKYDKIGYGVTKCIKEHFSFYCITVCSTLMNEEKKLEPILS